MVIRHNRRTTRTELERVFWCWFYFHLRVQKHYYGPLRGEGWAIAPIAPPPPLSGWEVAYLCWRRWRGQGWRCAVPPPATLAGARSATAVTTGSVPSNSTSSPHPRELQQTTTAKQLLRTARIHHTNVRNATLFRPTEGLLRFLQMLMPLWKEPVVMCGNWNASKHRHSKCSKWSPSAWIYASSLFRHWSIALYTMFCWNADHIATSRCRNSSVSRTGTRYTRSSCSVPQMR